MGPPRFAPADIPFATAVEQPTYALAVEGGPWN